MKTDEFLNIGAVAAEGALISAPGVVLEEIEEGRKFVTDYNAKNFAEPIGAYTTYAYDATLILLNALSACGDNPTPETMAMSILNSETTGVMGTTTFNEIGQTTNVAVYFSVIQDGAWVPYKNSEYISGTRSFGGQ